MCLAIPSRVVQVEDLTALVEVQGRQRAVSLMLLDEPVAVGDYLLVRNGQFAYERIDAGSARATLALIDGVVQSHDGSDLRPW